LILPGRNVVTALMHVQGATSACYESGVTVAALAVSIVSVLVAVAGVVYARLSVRSARGSEVAAKESAEAAKQLAGTQAARLEIDQSRAHLEMTPVLVGIVRSQPIPSRPGMITYRLEVHVKTPRPLTSLTLQLPADSGVGARRDALGMKQNLIYPEEGKSAPNIGPGHPASWHVEMAGPALAPFSALASCHDANGGIWNGVEVPITLENAKTH
jgi:hypothetical protein